MSIPKKVLHSRHIAILKHYAEGLTVQEISDQLRIRRHVIKGYMDDVKDSLGARNTTNAIYIAVKEGII